MAAGTSKGWGSSGKIWGGFASDKVLGDPSVLLIRANVTLWICSVRRRDCGRISGNMRRWVGNYEGLSAYWCPALYQPYFHRVPSDNHYSTWKLKVAFVVSFRAVISARPNGKGVLERDKRFVYASLEPKAIQGVFLRAEFSSGR